MAEIVASAVASEAVSRISILVSGERVTTHQSAEDKAERLEMAVLKIQSIVAVSEDLRITHLPLLQWKAKLKRVAVEGDILLHVHKKKTLERRSTTGTTSSFSQYLAHAAKRFARFRGGGREEDELSDSTLQRFERLAEGAESFFRVVVQSSSRPQWSVPSSLPSLTQSLLAGNSMEFCLQRPGSSDLVLLFPWRDPDAKDEDELEAFLMVAREDEVTWQGNLKMVISFRVSEARNVLAIAMSCLILLPPQFGAAHAAITGLLHQTIASESDRWRSNNLSPMSMWCRSAMRDYFRSNCGPPHNPNLECPTNFGTMMVLSGAVIRFTTFCYALPAAAMDESSSPLKNNGFPLKMACHVSPYLLPEKHYSSSQFLQVEQNVILEMTLPKVEKGFYDDQRQAPVECKREILVPSERNVWLSGSRDYATNDDVKSILEGKF